MRYTKLYYLLSFFHVLYPGLCPPQNSPINCYNIEIICSIQFSCSAVPNSLQVHGLCHAWRLSPSPTPGACSNYWSFSFSTSPPNEYSGLIYFRVDWFHLLSVQETLKSLLQPHSSKASILQCSGFFMVQISHPYLTTGKIIAFTIWTFVNKVMSLLFNMLSRLVITFLPRSKRLLISWL